MNKKIPLRVAGVVFTIVALAHLLRIIFLPTISIEGYLFPVSFNYIGFIITLVLAIWMFAASSSNHSSKDYFHDTKSLAKNEQTSIENKLKGLKVAILLADGFEQVEMEGPRKALETAGAKVSLVSPAKGKVKGWKHTEWGDEFRVDVQLDQANPQDYQALMLPGGVMNPDRLRLSPKAIQFIKHFHENNKPIAAICHAPWSLINAEAVKNRKVTSWPSIKTDLINAGAIWFDEQVVKDGKLITSRKPDDIPAFNLAMLDLFAERP